MSAVADSVVFRKTSQVRRKDSGQQPVIQHRHTVVIAALLEIPDEEYDSPDAVVVELVAV